MRPGARRLALRVACLMGLASAATAQETPRDILDAAKGEGKVTIYGSTESEIMQAVQQSFEAKYGIKTEYWRASSTKVMDRVLTETRAGKPLFDVVLTNARGPHVQPMADHAFAMLLALTHHIPELWEDKKARRWDGSPRA